MKCANLIKIDYYDGAFGPSINIVVPSRELLLLLKDTFQKLVKGSLNESKLSDISFVILTGIKDLNLQVIAPGKLSRKTVKILDSKRNTPVCFWSNSKEGWSECSGLLEGLLEANIPSHQYLSEEGIDDAVIIVTYLEQ